MRVFLSDLHLFASSLRKTRAEVLRDAKLELLKENPNAFFWGAFVMVGDPGK